MLSIKLSVGQRIGLGYIIAVGIAVSGTVAGFSIGNYYHQQAAEREKHARSESELLYNLQKNILQARNHQQRLITLLKKPQLYHQQYTYLLEHKIAIEDSWSKLKLVIKINPVSDGDVHLEAIPKLLQIYYDVPKNYFQGLENLRAKINTFNFNSPKDIAKAQNILLEFSNSELAIKFDDIANYLENTLQQAEKEADEAEQLFNESSIIAQRIVMISVALSVAIAIILAIVISQAIARPIQTLTDVAKRSTEESNFDLLVNINRNDELGILAKSFNRLITTVKHLLQEQKAINTQLLSSNESLAISNSEINEKNIRLQQVLTELKRTQLQMIQSEKMSTLGQMVSGIAHEINNPVSFIHGNLIYVQKYVENLLYIVDLYQKYYPEAVSEIVESTNNLELEFIREDLPKILHSMQTGTDRIANIVLSLRNFSHLDESGLKAVDIHDGINNTLLILKHRLKETSERPAIQIIKNYSNLPLIECYPGQINQVFLHILTNAIDAIEDTPNKYKNSQITISTALIDTDWIKIAIADNGSGIPEDILDKIFQPFFTTKPSSKGTGLGMSISEQIITKQHRGKINCISKLGEGTEFNIQIPISQNITVDLVK